jgi:hypothetical protein
VHSKFSTDSKFESERSNIKFPLVIPSYTPGSYFKLEQEASIQEHKRKLIKEGRLPSPTSTETDEEKFSSSEAAFETNPEILQAQARINAPDAAKRKEYELRAHKGASAPLTNEERWRYRASASAFTAAVGHVPRLSLSGRNRYGIPLSHTNDTSLAVRNSPGPHTLSPEAAEVARRSYIASVRALAYGSLLGIGLLAIAGTATAQYIGIGSGQDFREKVQGVMLPIKEDFRVWVAPWKARAEAWSMNSATSGRDDGDGIQSRLRNKYNPSNSSYKVY